MRKRVTVLTLCVCVCVCVCVCGVYCSRTKFIRQTDFSLRFHDFQLTELSGVVSFTSYRPFRSFFEVAAIFLHDELPRAQYTHAQPRFYMEHTISHVAFPEFVLLSS